MKAKLKVELTMRIEEVTDVSLNDLKDIVRTMAKEGKFQINNISFKADYREEVDGGEQDEN